MTTVKITSRRRVTLPKSLCDEMRVRPGDSLIVEQLRIDNEDTWVIQRSSRADKGSLNRLGWVGSLKRYAVGKSHDMAAVRRSIEKDQSGKEI